ncbi:MAG TPA: Fe-S-binding domain-containing protein [Elusimicrobia bacterium]|nr:Fe-S-binding domain-containing protein [Elusimicrobiota bacterium]
MLLTWLWLAPALAMIVVWAMPSRGLARGTALLFSLGLFAYSLWLLAPYSEGLLHLEELGVAGPLGIRYRLSVDGIALSLCWLSALLTVLSLAASWKADVPNAFWASFLGLEAALMGVFCARDLFYFYLFWDIALIPMFFIIGLWGSSGRRKASLKFVLYTFLGSLSLLIGLLALVTLHHQATGVWTWDMSALEKTPIAGRAALWTYAALALGFAVKIPVFPLHNWLPDAHTEAPAAGSVMLAGSMLKMGLFGFLRVLLPVFPDLSAAALPVLGGLGVVNILYGALCAMAQSDLKRLVAFTSVSHLGFCLVGLFSLTAAGIAGASLQMLNHGLSTGGLFLLVGMLYERAHRRGLNDFGELASRTPIFAFFFAFILLSSIGLPGLNGFVGETMCLAGMAKASLPLTALGLIGTVLAAAYGLPAFQAVFWAPAGPGSASPGLADLDLRERLILWTLVALILWLGLYPRPMLELLEPAASALAQR